MATHSKGSYFAFDDTGDTLRDATSVTDSVNFSNNADTAEVSTFGATTKAYVVGLIDASLGVGGPWDATFDGYYNGVLGYETARDWEYGPEGNASGDIKYSGTALCSNYSFSSGIGGAVTYSATWTVTGTVTRAAVP